MAEDDAQRAPTPQATEVADDAAMPLLVARSAVGGVLMGLANLVPGISGGTMLVASGIYPRFIDAIAELTRLRFRKRSLVVLGVVLLAVAVSIVALAGPVRDLVVSHRWAMFSLFIGLTFGGVPVVWAMAKPATSATWRGAAAGFLVMVAIAVFQYGSADGTGGEASFGLLFMAGLLGASAMILPGVSGGYLLLVLGVYEVILTGIDATKDAAKAGDLAALVEPFLGVVLPVGLGVVIGIVAVSNLLKRLLETQEKATLGVLLGFLVGAPVGLWPFREGVAPDDWLDLQRRGGDGRVPGRDPGPQIPDGLLHAGRPTGRHGAGSGGGRLRSHGPGGEARRRRLRPGKPAGSGPEAGAARHERPAATVRLAPGRRAHAHHEPRVAEARIGGVVDRPADAFVRGPRYRVVRVEMHGEADRARPRCEGVELGLRIACISEEEVGEGRLLSSPRTQGRNLFGEGGEEGPERRRSGPQPSAEGFRFRHARRA